MGTGAAAQQPTAASPPADAIRDQLDTLLADPLFTAAPRLSRLLSYLVGESLAGHDRELLEYAVGLEVFDRGADFDPRNDTIVRVQARRLRERLARYYGGPGARDPIVIELPKGHYRAAFRYRTQTPPDRGTRARPQHRRRYLLNGLVVTLVAALLVAVWFAPHPQDAADSTTVAVLPFASLVDRPGDSPFGHGITEEIRAALARQPDLRVLASTTASALGSAGDEVTLAQLSRALGVGYLIRGSVRRDGERLRVTARLVDDAGVEVWSHDYERNQRDLFSLQAEIVAALTRQVAPEVDAPLPPTRQPDLEAYRHYLIGHEMLSRRLPGYLDRAAEELALAVAIDPEFADAQAELAVGLAIGAHVSVDESGQLQRAAEAIDKALALHPELPRALAARGLLNHMRLPMDLAAAERDLRRALELDPYQVDASNWLGVVLNMQGRLRAGRDVLDRAVRLDPLAPILTVNLANMDARLGRFAEAERRLLQLITLPYPQFLARETLSSIYTAQGRLVDATRSAKAAIVAYLAGRDRIAPRSSLIGLYGMLGLWDLAERWQDRLERDWPEHYHVAAARAVTLRRQGLHAEALALHRQLLRDRALEVDALAEFDAAEVGVSMALAGEHDAALRMLESRQHQHLMRSGDPLHTPRQTLSWVYLQTGDRAAARQLLAAAEAELLAADRQGMLENSQDIMRAAQTALLSGNMDLAMQRLERAVDAGWRDYHLLMHSPLWSGVTDHPRLRNAMARVAADLAWQRDEVAARDADDGLTERITALREGSPPDRQPDWIRAP